MASLTAFWPDVGMTHTHDGHDGADLSGVWDAETREVAR